MNLKDDYAVILITYKNIPIEQSSDFIKQWQSPTNNDLIILKMCHTILQELFDGTLLIEVLESAQSNTQTVEIQLLFNINNPN